MLLMSTFPTSALHTCFDCPTHCAPDYGLERMAQEAAKGPQGIFKPSAGTSKQQQQQQVAEESDADVANSGEELEDEQNGSLGSESGQ